MDTKLPIAEQVLLSFLDGATAEDLQAAHGQGMQFEIDYLERLRSCTRWSHYYNSYIKKDNYGTVMGGSQ